MFSLEKREVKKEKRGIRARVSVYILCSLFVSFSSYAQCAMCRAALGGKENNAQAAAVNDGIVYLMVIPYVLVAAIGYYVYRMKKKKP
jgi:heme/copper-type cytochrome/quinol oxidase subunit 2